MLYGIATLAVVVSFRFLRFPDLTVDGSFVLGAVIAGVSLRNGASPATAIFLAVSSGFLAGLFTAAWHRLLGINRFFAGILTMMMLYSVNLRILGGANISLLDTSTVFGTAGDGLKSLVSAGSFVVSGAIVLLVFWSRLGLQIRACGSNSTALPLTENRITVLTFIGLGIANAFAGLAGALVAQYQRFADVGMGLGVTVNVFAALFLGEGLLVAFVGVVSLLRGQTGGSKMRRLAGGGVVVGEIMAAAVGMLGFMGIVTATLYWGLRPSDTKFFGALLLLAGLVWRRASKASFLVAPGEFEK
jgi:putative ABC transport system permease protein